MKTLKTLSNKKKAEQYLCCTHLERKPLNKKNKIHTKLKYYIYNPINSYGPSLTENEFVSSGRLCNALMGLNHVQPTLVIDFDTKRAKMFVQNVPVKDKHKILLKGNFLLFS